MAKRGEQLRDGNSKEKIWFKRKQYRKADGTMVDCWEANVGLDSNGHVLKIRLPRPVYAVADRQTGEDAVLLPGFVNIWKSEKSNNNNNRKSGNPLMGGRKGGV